MDHNLVVAPTPLALVGIGCRFPGGVCDADSLWQMLIERRTAVTEVPDDRWATTRYYHSDTAATGRMITRRGGFVSQLKQFDAAFWGISPREAARLDPQQRWLLETAWESVEDAGIPPSSLRGANVGVFVGASSHDYGTLQLDDLANLDVHTNTGGTLSIAANRISYQFDLRGPSIAVDTACSSALVAVSMACRSIWSGECEAALAGGVNALILPNSSIGFSKASMLSPDGECFAFDQRANGYVRGEGAGFVLLKPMDRALEDRDPIYAVVRAAVVNQDGHTSSMTVPGVEGQSEMLRTAYHDAGIPPRHVVYMEAHGTGTPVGDPIEAKALGNVLSAGRQDGETCLLGSIKTNIGHLESASGVAGLIKTALVLDRDTVPPNTNFRTPSAEIPFEDLKLKVADKQQPLPRVDGANPVASVNSFGFGGTNAHVVLEAAPCRTGLQARPDGPGDPSYGRPFVLPISARDDVSLRAYAKEYRRILKDLPATDLADFCYSAGARHEQHEQRLVVTGNDAKQLSRGLGNWLQGTKAADGVFTGSPGDTIESNVFVYTGQGSQWFQMGRQLIAREPIVRQTIEEIDDHFHALSGWSLLDELLAGEDPATIDQTKVCQPAIFALQVALTKLWKSWGIEPNCVLGHSVGEVAAAWCAGALSIEDATRLIYHRSRLQDSTAGRGRMLVAGITPEQANEAIGLFSDRVQVTAINSPELVTLGGDTEPLETIGAKLEAEGRFVRWLRLDYAFHTHQMEEITDELLDALKGIKPQPSCIPFVSTVTGQVCPGEELNAGYWWRNVREAVLFEPAVSGLVSRGERRFLELGPHHALRSSLESCLAAQGVQGQVFHSIARDRDESQELAANIARLHVAGVELDWQAVNQSAGNFIRQPRYPWNYQEYWLDEGAYAARTTSPIHPLLGERLRSACPTWQFKLDPLLFPYLKDHRIWDGIVFPAAGYVEIGLAVARELFPEERCAVEDVESKNALFVPENNVPTIQVVFNEESKTFSVFSSTDEKHWEIHATGRLIVRTTAGEPEGIDPQQVRETLTDRIAHDSLYDELHALGYGFGPDFSLIREISVSAGRQLRVVDYENVRWSPGFSLSSQPKGCTPADSPNYAALAEIDVPEHIAVTADDYCFHPAVLDACFQATHGSRDTAAENARPNFFYLPESIRRVQLFQDKIPTKLLAYAEPTKDNGTTVVCDVHVYDEYGGRVADIVGFQVAKVEHRKTGDSTDDCLYQFQWEPRRLKGTGIEGTCCFPETHDLVASVESKVQEVYEENDLETYYNGYLPRIDQSVIRFIQNAFLQLGWNYQPGDCFTNEEFVENLGITDEHHRLAAAQLGWLATAGVVSRTDTGWRVESRLEESNVADDLATLGDQYPRFAAEVALVEATGPCLAEVLSGDTDPLELLFPGGSNELLERFYTQAADLPAFNRLMQTLLAEVVEALPSRRALRILEIGGGTGSLTRAVLDVLPAGHFEYLFTDVGPAFVADAQKRFADVVGLEFKTFDVERSPEGQGIEPGSYDLVLASNVLHATADLKATLANVRSCLAADGMFAFLDTVGRRAMLDNVFGLLKGWWRFTDLDERPDSPLIDQQQWTSLLTRCGFENVESFTCSPREDETEQVVFVSRSWSPGFSQSMQPEGCTPAGCSLVFTDESGVAKAVTDQLTDRGDTVVQLRRGTVFQQLSDTEFTLVNGSADELTSVFGKLNGREIAHVVHCWSLDGPNAKDLETAGHPHLTHPAKGTTELLDAQSVGVLGALNLAQVLNNLEFASPPRVYFVTRGAQTTSDGDPTTGVPSAPLIGFCRVANNEMAQFEWTTIDLDPNGGVHETENLLHEISLANSEYEVAFRDDNRLVNRLRRTRLDSLAESKQNAVQPDGQLVPFRVQMRKAGVLSDLTLNETGRRAPGPDEVEVCVKAAGINFRDVMKALGMYPGDSPDLLWLGDDFAGVVERVGSNVADLKPGDVVAGVARYAFRSHLTVDHRMTFKTGANMPFEAAATLPTVFMTSHFAINQIARMQPGEKILIHAGAGGIGQSAIQIAQHRGVEVFATAGTPEKRELLRTMGVRHVMNSRTLEFADEIMDVTHGQGVDAVLNSLSDEFIPKSLGVLAPFGRFLEIGKIDVYGNSKVGLAAFKNNISYHVIDLAQVIAERPQVVEKIFQELSERFAAGDYAPLTHKVFPVSEVVDAFRYMAQGQHIGKNVLSFDTRSLTLRVEHDRDADARLREPSYFSVGPCTEDGQRLRSDATYLITGGAGGFGLEVAKWMADQGARNLVLMSRSGPRDEAAADVETLRAGGVNVLDLRGDVTKPEDVRRVFEEVEGTCPPLKGVVHAAMVLDDEFITGLDEERFNRVLHPKILGAWNLHEATKQLPLDHFVCFSSFSSVVGAPKQSNYNAGNFFLDALAQYRRSSGLPALTVNWGAIVGAGFVDRNQKTADYLDSIGMSAFHVEEALGVLSEMMLRDTPLVAAARMVWKRLARLSPAVNNSPTYAAVAQDGTEGQSDQSLRKQLAAAAADERQGILESHLVEQVAGVFGIQASSVDRTAPLTTLGLDSLMAVELMNRIESETGTSIPMSSVLSGPNVQELSATILGLISYDDGEPAAAIETSDTPAATAIDFEAESQLDADIVPNGPIVQQTNDSRLFLTGATGYLGAYLLCDLLDKTNSEVVCLVRADNEQAGLQRIRDNLAGYSLEARDFENRVKVVVGDFSQPRFGLSEDAFDRLAEEVDAIYHNGANVNLLLPYESLGTNVIGTREVLRLACRVKTKPTHFVSTFTVFTTEANRGVTVAEMDDLPPCEELLYGYSQTKWVGEKMIAQARRRGLPAAIYRPGHITGDSDTGATNVNDLLHTIVLACLRLEAAPFNDVDLDLTPVNYVAQAVVALSARQESLGGNFHLTNPQPLQTQVLIEYLKQANVTVNLIGYEQWRERMIALAEQVGLSLDEFGVLADVLLPRVSGNEDRGLHPHFDSRLTQEALESSGVRCPPVDAELLRTGHDFLQRSGVAAEPRTASLSKAA